MSGAKVNVQVGTIRAVRAPLPSIASLYRVGLQPSGERCTRGCAMSRRRREYWSEPQLGYAPCASPESMKRAWHMTSRGRGLALVLVIATSHACFTLASCGGTAQPPEPKDDVAVDSPPDAPSGIDGQSCAANVVGRGIGCGPSQESCCTMTEAPSGTFELGVSSGPFSLAGYSTTLSAFRMDKYEVTVGRFRAFVEAIERWRPRPDDGAHPAALGSGWRSSWPLVDSAERLRAELKACGGTWTDHTGANETHPITCITWFELFAFCIWDGRRMPTMAQRVYVASGGDEYRTFPWSPARDFDAGGEDGKLAFSAEGGAPRIGPEPVGSFPSGAGRWGHLDLAGNAHEWVIEPYEPYPFPTLGEGGCRDCAVIAEDDHQDRLHHGGSYASDVHSYSIGFAKPTARLPTIGGRCAQ